MAHRLTPRPTPAKAARQLTDAERQQIGEAIENAARDGNVEWLVAHYLDTCQPEDARKWVAD